VGSAASYAVPVRVDHDASRSGQDEDLGRKEQTMSSTVIFTTIVLALVIGILVAVGYALYECTPLAHRLNPYRNHTNGERRGESPHVDEYRDYC
jgi:hypothetical protein